MMLAAILVLTATPADTIPVRATAVAEEEVPSSELMPEAEPEIQPEEEPEATKEPREAETPMPTEKPKETEAPKPTVPDTIAPTHTPAAQTTPSPSAPGSDSTHTVAPSATPAASETPGTSVTPEASVTPGTSETPEASVTPETSVTPEASVTPGTSETPEASVTPDASVSPVPSASVEPEATLREKQKKKKKSIYTTWYGVVDTDEEGMPIPIYYQTDYPETIVTIRGIPRSVKSSGCGAACSAMVIGYFTGDMEVTPKTVFLRAVETGRYNGAGLSRETISFLLGEYGIHTKRIPNRAEDIIQALQEGKPVIAHMGRGIFTKGGHYVLLKGIAEDGRILLNDPVSPIKTHRKFPIETLLTQAGGTRAFQVCWTDELEESLNATPEPSIEPTLAPEENLEASEVGEDGDDKEVEVEAVEI